MVLVDGLILDLFTTAVVLSIYGFLAAMWIHRVCSKMSPGIFRLLGVLPVLVLNALAPFLCDYRVFQYKVKAHALAMNIFVVFLVAWLTNCKVLAYAFNRGYLAKVEKWSSWKFFGVYLCPIQPKVVKAEDKSLEESEPSAWQEIRFKFYEFGRLVFLFVVKNGFLLLFAVMVMSETSLSGPFGDALTYNGLLMVWLGQSFDLSQAVALAVFNITCVDSFNHPYLATTLTELWGERWNTMTAGVIKPLSFDIIRDGSFVRPNYEDMPKSEKPKRSPGIIAAAVMSVFVMSGLWHFLTFWYLTQRFAWGWLVFFAAYGPIVIVEGAVKNFVQVNLGIKSVPKYLSMPIGIAYTLGVTTVMASVLFFPPAKAAGVESLVDYYQKRCLGRYAIY